MAGTDDLTELSGRLYRQWEKSMTGWWDQVLDDPSFVGAMGKQLEASSRARRSYEEQVDQTMSAMHLPSRKDVIRLAKIASLLEDRLLSLEDTLHEQTATMHRLEKELLQARVDAAESLVSMQERLAGLEARLAELQPTPAAPEPAPAKKPARRSRRASPKKEG